MSHPVCLHLTEEERDALVADGWTVNSGPHATQGVCEEVCVEAPPGVETDCCPGVAVPLAPYCTLADRTGFAADWDEHPPFLHLEGGMMWRWDFVPSPGVTSRYSFRCEPGDGWKLDCGIQKDGSSEDRPADVASCDPFYLEWNISFDQTPTLTGSFTLIVVPEAP